MIGGLDVSGSTVVGAAATAHLFVAGLSAGGGLFLAVDAARIARGGDAGERSWARRHARLLAVAAILSAAGAFALVTVVRALHPRAAALLSDAMPWLGPLLLVAVAAELGAALAHAIAFDRLGARVHARLGGVRAAAGAVGLAAVSLADGFLLDPAPLPAPAPALFAVRTLAALALGGLALPLSGARAGPDLRAGVARAAAVRAVPAALAALVVAALCLGALEPAAAGALEGEVPAATRGAWVAAAATLLLAAGALAAWWLAPTHPALAAAPAAALAAVAAVGLAAGHAVRAGVASPWIVGLGEDGVVYANGLRPAEVSRARADGIAAVVPAARRPADVFEIACRACHSLSGPGGIREHVDGVAADGVAAALARLERLRGRMPPFPGNDADRDALAAWLAGLDGREDPPPAPDPARIARGRAVYLARCRGCHEDVPLRPRVAGWTEAQADDAIRRLPRLAPVMPPFPGTPAERSDLAAYLAALGAGGDVD